MNILLVKLSALGDVIHTLPSLAALRRLYPRAHITWVVEEEAADLLMGHPDLDAVLVSGRKRWFRDLCRGRVRPLLAEGPAFVRALRSRSYDLVIDFHGLFKSAVIVGLSAGKRRLGYDSLQELSGLVLTETIPERLDKHAVDRYLDLVCHLGAPRPEPVFPLPSLSEQDARMARLLREQGIDPDGPFVAISPQALWPTKGWPGERFSLLADRIAGDLGVPVVFTGTADAAMPAAPQRAGAAVANLAGKTGLRDLACVLKRSSLLVTPDSGPMHLAAAVGTPTVALFGPTNPARTGPYGNAHVVLRRALACSPCYRKTCKTRECLDAIPVEEVFAAVEERLAQGRERRPQ